ncbi:MAG: lactate utilization protein [Spirochaetales bacterium]|jgi:L-lactate utilization protein LutB|nr:lactate utilization protein [Spirochaetales bacterium]
MNEVMRWHHEALAKRTVEALKKNHFDAVYFQGAREAAEFVMGFVKEGASVGFGGSMTITDMGMQEKVKAKGGVVLDHNAPGLSDEERAVIRRKQLLCDVFLTGTNAVTIDGCLLNVDGAGNRVAAMTFGPGKVIVVAGTNKIRKNLDEALERVRHYAAPLNNKRLAKTNPCTVTGTCMDCQADTRICNIYTTMKRKPSVTDMTVVLVGEALGY